MASGHDSTTAPSRRLPASGGPVTPVIKAIRADEPFRRGFLRGLLALPFIGGGLALIGAPTAVAEPVSEALLREYHDWLLLERRLIAQEITGSESSEPGLFRKSSLAWHERHMPGGAGASPPSTRAALVLSTVGCDWR